MKKRLCANHPSAFVHHAVQALHSAGSRHAPSRRSAQRGDALIESLLAILLASVIALGLSYSASRLLNTQRTLNAQNIAFHDVREGLLSQGFSAAEICAAPGEDKESIKWDGPAGATKDGKPIAFKLTCQSSSVTVNGLPISLNTIQSIETDAKDANAKDLFGGDGTLSLKANTQSKKE